MKMTNYDDIIEVQNCLVENWGEDGKAVIVACLHEDPFNDSFESFLSHCTACGGNWGGMILSGIKELYPKVWDLIPDNMGSHAFSCICNTLILLGVDTTE